MMAQHNSKKENSTSQKPDALSVSQSSVPPSPGDHGKESWQETLGDFGSRLTSRYSSIAEWVKGHITSPAQPISIRRQDATTLNQQISAKGLWSDTLAQRASELSQTISNARQENNFLCEPTEFAWFNPERANRPQIIGDRTTHHTDFQDIDGWQQKNSRYHTEYSPAVLEEPGITSTRKMLQHKAIAHAEPAVGSERTPISTSEPRLIQAPSQSKTTIDLQVTDSTTEPQHQPSSPESEFAHSPKESARNLQSGDIHSSSDKENSPVLHTYPEKIYPPINSVITEAETIPTDSAAHHSPDHVTDTSLSQESMLPPISSVEKPAIIHKQSHVQYPCQPRKDLPRRSSKGTSPIQPSPSFRRLNLYRRFNLRSWHVHIWHPSNINRSRPQYSPTPLIGLLANQTKALLPNCHSLTRDKLCQQRHTSAANCSRRHPKYLAVI
jgi:hypothetical protein